jgi:hypothetical protein
MCQRFVVVFWLITAKKLGKCLNNCQVLWKIRRWTQTLSPAGGSGVVVKQIAQGGSDRSWTYGPAP